MTNLPPKECPLCISTLNNNEYDFYPCPCGYQICAFCFERLMDDETQRKCPYCRRPYDEDARDRKGPQFKPTQNASTHTTVVSYFISPKIVQVVGLPEKLLISNVLRQDKYFGQYGPIQKISIDSNSTAPSSKTILPNTTKPVFIKFTNPNDAKACILALDGFKLNYEGMIYPIQVSLAVVEQCPKLQNGKTCTQRTCLKRHRQQRDSDISISASEIDSKDPGLKSKINPSRPPNYELFPKRTNSITVFPPLRLAPPVYFPFIHTQIYSQNPPNLYDLFMYPDVIPPAKFPVASSETVPLSYTLNLDQ